MDLDWAANDDHLNLNPPPPPLDLITSPKNDSNITLLLGSVIQVDSKVKSISSSSSDQTREKRIIK